MSRLAITVLLPVYNVERYVQRTIDSVRFADELLVVDSFSTDSTVEICKRAGARVVQHEYLNSAIQKNWALQYCSHDWVFQIDSDELLGENADEEIRSAVEHADEDVCAFRLPRKNYVLGRWMRYGGVFPDYQTRLFRTGRARWVEREVHAQVDVSGRIDTLATPIHHYGMPDLSKQLSNMDRYTRYEADQMKAEGRRFRARQLLLRPPAVFLRRFLWKRGYLDGWRGFFVSTIIAANCFFAHAKLWELEELNLPKSPRGGYDG